MSSDNNSPKLTKKRRSEEADLDPEQNKKNTPLTSNRNSNSSAPAISTEFLVFTLNQISDPVLLIEEDRILWTNLPFQIEFGYDLTDLITQTIPSSLSPSKALDSNTDQDIKKNNSNPDLDSNNNNKNNNNKSTTIPKLPFLDSSNDTATFCNYINNSRIDGQPIKDKLFPIIPNHSFGRPIYRRVTFAAYDSQRVCCIFGTLTSNERER